MLDTFYQTLSNIESYIQTEIQLHFRIILYVIILIITIFWYKEHEDHENAEAIKNEYQEKMQRNELILQKLAQMSDEDRIKFLDALQKESKNSNNNSSYQFSPKKMIVGATIAEFLRSGDLSKIAITAVVSGAATCVSRIIK